MAGKPGRPSLASQTVSAISKLDVIQRPDAPYDLTDEQAQEWWAVVNRMPADWFPRETHGMLAQYCRHVVRARRVAQMLDAMEKSDDFDV
jgi:chaperone required for assembly of F1-ATPase